MRRLQGFSVKLLITGIKSLQPPKLGMQYGLFSIIYMRNKNNKKSLGLISRTGYRIFRWLLKIYMVSLVTGAGGGPVGTIRMRVSLISLR